MAYDSTDPVKNNLLLKYHVKNKDSSRKRSSCYSNLLFKV